MSFIDHLNKWLTALQALAVVGGVVVALYQLNEIAAQTAIQSRTLEDQKIGTRHQPNTFPRTIAPIPKTPTIAPPANAPATRRRLGRVKYTTTINATRYVQVTRIICWVVICRSER